MGQRTNMDKLIVQGQLLRYFNILLKPKWDWSYNLGTKMKLTLNTKRQNQKLGGRGWGQAFYSCP